MLRRLFQKMRHNPLSLANIFAVAVLYVVLVFLHGEAHAFTLSISSPSSTPVSYNGTCYRDGTAAVNAVMVSYPRDGIFSNNNPFTDDLDSISSSGNVVTVYHTGVSQPETLVLLPCDGLYSYPVNRIALVFGCYIVFALGWLIAVSTI